MLSLDLPKRIAHRRVSCLPRRLVSELDGVYMKQDSYGAQIWDSAKRQRVSISTSDSYFN